MSLGPEVENDTCANADSETRVPLLLRVGLRPD